MIEKWKNKYLKKYKLKSVGNISYLVQIGELHDAKKVLKLNDTGWNLVVIWMMLFRYFVKHIVYLWAMLMMR